MSDTDDTQETEPQDEAVEEDRDTSTDNRTDSRTATDDDPIDPPRETTPGRGQGHGSWLEEHVAETLEEWGYTTETRVELLALSADVVARRDDFQDDPDDFLVVQCKDWEKTPVGKQPIIRLCLLAFIARAMPVLCHTSRLTQEAWELAQAYDVRLLNLTDLEYDQLPPLTACRPPSGTNPHREEQLASEYRSALPVMLWMRCRPDGDIEGPVFGRPDAPPCYVTDRTGHTEYPSAYDVDYTFHERRR